ncbi:class I tRNA ligase family protein [Candidatus Gracilibacteria bacterium]|nr:class I tRNA ligase family protein [Candidatus Gracilibacteria bacterium]
MSKSLKNVVNPDDIVEEYGADSLRLYEMYMAEFKDTAPWDSKGIVGVRRFLDKVERAFGSEEGKIAEDDDEAIKLLNKTIKKVEEDIENYKFNTAIASMIILVNYGRPTGSDKLAEWKTKFTIILSAFAPHLGEELWEDLGNEKSVFFASWPEYNKDLVVDDSVKIGVQVLGKLRGTIEIAVDEEKDSVLEKAKSETNVAKWLEGKNVVKEIYVPGKIVNLVVK